MGAVLIQNITQSDQGRWRALGKDEGTFLLKVLQMLALLDLGRAASRERRTSKCPLSDGAEDPSNLN